MMKCFFSQTNPWSRFGLVLLVAVTLAACSGDSGNGGIAPATCTVVYDGNGANGGSVPVDNTAYLEGQTVTVLGNTGNLVRAGYTFAGWATQADGSGTTYSLGAGFTMGTADVILYAKWTTNPTYSVTYAGNGADGGSVPVDTTGYQDGQTVTVLGNTGNLVRAGYAFAGWATQADGNGTTYTSGAAFPMGTADVILYAKWTTNPTFTVTYAGNGADGGSVPVDTTGYQDGQTVTVLGNTGNLVMAGYVFAGWNTQADGSGTTYTQGQTFPMGAADFILYARWTANPTFTVTYAGNGADGGQVPVDNTPYEEGQVVSVAGNTGNLVRTGYVFAEWSTQADGNGTAYPPGAEFTMGAADITLYAQWTAASAYITWNKIYAGDGRGGEAFAAQQTADGGYIIAGDSWAFGASYSDVMLIKIDENGNEIWNKILDISDGDAVRCVRQTSDGGYVLAGNAYSYAIGATDAWILKTDGNGNRLWSTTFDGGNHNGDSIFDVLETSDGGYVLAGYTNSYRPPGWQTDGLLIKTDANGVKVWHQLYGGSAYGDYIYSVEQTPDGGFILSGSTSSYSEALPDAWLIKTDENGDASAGHGWEKTFGGNGRDEAFWVQRTSDGGYILAGSTRSFADIGDECGYLIKTDGLGNLDASFGTNGQAVFGTPTVNSWIQSIDETSDGGFIAAGYTTDPDNIRNGILIKTDAHGNAASGHGWQKAFNFSDLDQLFYVEQTDDSGFLAAGYTAFGGLDFSMWLIKTDPLGNAPETP